MALHNSGIGVWRHDNSPYGLVVMSPSANLPRCVMPFWTHAHAFSLYDVIMSSLASQITHLTIVYSKFYSRTDQRKHQSSASLAFVWRNLPVNDEFPAQRARNAENVSIWWRPHVRVTALPSLAVYIFPPIHKLYDIMGDLWLGSFLSLKLFIGVCLSHISVYANFRLTHDIIILLRTIKKATWN